MDQGKPKREGVGGYATPLNFRGGLNSCQPSLISEKKILAHICYYVQVNSIGGEGGLVPLKLT